MYSRRIGDTSRIFSFITLNEWTIGWEVYLHILVNIAVYIWIGYIAHKQRRKSLRNQILICGLPGIVFFPLWIAASIRLASEYELGQKVEHKLQKMEWKIFWGVEAVFGVWFFLYMSRYVKSFRAAAMYDSDYLIDLSFLVFFLISMGVIIIGSAVTLLSNLRGNGRKLWKLHSFFLMFALCFFPSVHFRYMDLFHAAYLIVFLATLGMEIYFCVILQSADRKNYVNGGNRQDLSAIPAPDRSAEPETISDREETKKEQPNSRLKMTVKRSEAAASVPEMDSAFWCEAGNLPSLKEKDE